MCSDVVVRAGQGMANTCPPPFWWGLAGVWCSVLEVASGEESGVGQPVSHVVSSFCRGDSVESWFDVEVVGDGS